MRDTDSSPRPAPIAVFAYRRRKHLQSMLESLMQCEGFADSDVTIFIDGPKGDADRDDVAAVRTFASGLALPNVQVAISEENRGLRRSIHEGVEALVRQHGRVIVLEDDLQLSPVALSYFNTALDAYADNERVKAVCGYMYDLGSLRPDACFFLPFASSWGWATWARAWRGFSVETKDYEALGKSTSFRKLFAAPNIVHSNLMLDAQLLGLIDSWAILWNAHIAAQGGICLFPPHTLVRNGGLAASGGTHSSRLNPFGRALSRIDARMTFATRFTLPDEVLVDFTMTDVVARTRQIRLGRMTTLLGYLRRRARGAVRRSRH